MDVVRYSLTRTFLCGSCSRDVPVKDSSTFFCEVCDVELCLRCLRKAKRTRPDILWETETLCDWCHAHVDEEESV